MPSRLTGSRTRSTPARTALSSALALVLLTASTACADFSRDVYMGDSGKHLSRTDLENRPSYDDAVARYDELRAGIQSVVTSPMPHAKEISRPGDEKARLIEGPHQRTQARHVALGCDCRRYPPRPTNETAPPTMPAGVYPEFQQ